ncbi:MAG: hypothetical protein ACYC1C_07065 [Chloroflexota bacterium]
MARQNENLQETLRLAQEAMQKCDVFYGEANDDSCRHIYGRIRDLLQEQKSLAEQEIASHKMQGQWEE